MEVKISVIIPVYNAEEFLCECMDSVLNQTFRDIEIICVDDGSTDGSKEILYKYQKEDERVKVLCQENKYAGVARNYGMSQAIGTYVIFLDADDLFELNMLEEVYNRLESTDAQICIFDGLRYDNKNKKCSSMEWIYKKEYLSDGQVFSKKDFPMEIFQVTTAVPWNKMYLRKFIEENKLKYQEIRNTNDVAFGFTALAVADRITTLDKQLMYYRYNVKSSLQETRIPMLFFQSLIQLQENLKMHGVYDEVKISFANRVATSCRYNFQGMKDEETYRDAYEYLNNTAWELFDLDCLNNKTVVDFKAYRFITALNVLSFEEYQLAKCLNFENVTRYPDMVDDKAKQQHPSKEIDYKKELEIIQNTKSYKIGRAITALPRWIRERK